MIQSRRQRAVEAIRSLVADGIPEQEIHEIVADVAVKTREGRVEAVDVEDLPIYDELPPGLIDLPSAAENHSLRIHTIRQWIYRGRIRAVARLRAPARGGGYLVVREAELIAYMRSPRDRGGRPRET